MVSLDAIRASNERIRTELPTGLVAVFVGATNGIGETSLKQFVKHTKRPRVYFIGRSDKAAKRIKTELKSLNPDGDYHFLKYQVSLLRNVDQACRDIKSKERTINLLFISAGPLATGTQTKEGLHLFHQAQGHFASMITLALEAHHIKTFLLHHRSTECIV
ncbi:uncharacterized protein F4822DRAFT_432668 [Hypoxylon trugodes]|uniref:uncharacterized protein n=1 Tax=Hypoxylon trugodes TaxID=326681 RepID=UPI00219F67A5|nr:uncharacterized protein F4822DRAFT_432668 [Hypoxylon trugodes]KAI1385809.1 hypothetical protein F4822DRAFT_432668 [Hypoxylon trugodes]